MQIKLLETIQHRSVFIEAGNVIDMHEADAHDLIAAGHAEPVESTASTDKES